MKVEVKKLDKLKRVIKIEVEGQEFLDEKKDVYSTAGKNLKVPGFRPGSVPADVLEKHHGKALQEELLKKVLPHFYRKALEEQKILPASLPRIYDVEINPEALSFHAEFEEKPELEVKESLYKGIKIKDKKIEIPEVEVEKILTNLKEGIKKVVNKDFEDDELAKWASYANAAKLKEAIRAQLFVEKTRERKQKIDTQIRNHLLKEFKVELPKAEVERHHKELVEREVYNLRARGISQEDIDKYKKEVEDKLKPVAEEEIKLFYILEAIGKNEGIKLDNNLGEVVLGFILSQAQYQE
jgi:FKBP-type peptidyl-prolyl cis-trans isomerase (trigger factor)